MTHRQVLRNSENPSRSSEPSPNSDNPSRSTELSLMSAIPGNPSGISGLRPIFDSLVASTHALETESTPETRSDRVAPSARRSAIPPRTPQARPTSSQTLASCGIPAIVPALSVRSFPAKHSGPDNRTDDGKDGETDEEEGPFRGKHGGKVEGIVGASVIGEDEHARFGFRVPIGARPSSPPMRPRVELPESLVDSEGQNVIATAAESAKNPHFRGLSQNLESCGVPAWLKTSELSAH